MLVHRGVDLNRGRVVRCWRPQTGPYTQTANQTHGASCKAVGQEQIQREEALKTVMVAMHSLAADTVTIADFFRTFNGNLPQVLLGFLPSVFLLSGNFFFVFSRSHACVPAV